jgi:hypothetical protein
MMSFEGEIKIVGNHRHRPSGRGGTRFPKADSGDASVTVDSDLPRHCSTKNEDSCSVLSGQNDICTFEFEPFTSKAEMSDMILMHCNVGLSYHPYWNEEHDTKTANQNRVDVIIMYEMDTLPRA